MNCTICAGWMRIGNDGERRAGMAQIGIIGGNGMLGRAIATALLAATKHQDETLWISCRSGKVEGLHGVQVTADNQVLVEACDIVLLAVPPAQIGALGIDAAGRLIVSVMAGISLRQIADATGGRRIVRAMSSPAAAMHLAFSPWVAGQGVGDGDKAAVTALFSACGATAQLENEAQVELFTALAGPVPGFVAFFAECMVDYATARGIPSQVADQAVRQLFLASGRMMAEEPATPAEHVRQMIDYAGTTAAGLMRLKGSGIASELANGLDAAVERTRSIGQE